MNDTVGQAIVDKPLEEIKKARLKELEEYKENKVLEPANVDFLSKLVRQAENVEEVEKLFTLSILWRRTGLVFQPTLEKVRGGVISYFSKDKRWSFAQDPYDLTHKLIIGDNFEALLNLLVEYRGKIDCIYIDPPYGKDAMGGFADTNYDNDISRDNLLSMLKPRLELAKELLSPEGVIFCSIDDRNEAYLKLLFDEVFGERNFYGVLIQRKGNTQNDAKTIQKNHEYILCYAKNFTGDLILSQPNIKKVPVLENKFILGRDTSASSAHDKLIERANLGYTIYYLKDTENGATGNHNKLIERAKELGKQYGFNYLVSENGKTFEEAIAVMDYDKDAITEDATEEEVYRDEKELLDSGFIPIRPPKRKGGKLGCWTWGFDTFKDLWNKDEVLIEEGRDRYKVIRKIFVDPQDIVEEGGKKYVFVTNTLPLQSVVDINNSNGTTLLSKDILPGCIFSNPKNPDLLKFLFSALPKKDALVLDFFAGSGTTGQAVLELNKKDGGQRRFILCTNNLEEDGKIAEKVTAPRLKRVMTGSDYDGTLDFPWAKKNEPLGGNLLVLDLKEISDKACPPDPTPFEVIDETLYGKKKFNTAREKISWVCENFDGAEERLKPSLGKEGPEC
ncbi:MAG: site-specific DNA-methyltransferase [Aeriscardovia sp.]|nr:site-specific DNA-methyltransferase [Aeriscardovia sp.]